VGQMSENSLLEIAELLRSRRATSTAGPAPQQCGVTTLTDAYRVQNLTRTSTSAPRHYKVGVTSSTLQSAFGIDHPAFGPLPDLLERDGAQVARHDFIAPLLEVEVAFVFGGPPADPRNADAVRAAVTEVRAAIEIADCRTLDWKIGVIDLVADSGCAGSAVLGGTRIAPDDLSDSFDATLTHDGQEIASGGDQLVAGGPWSTLTWLASELADQHLGLDAGSVVLTGSCTPPTVPPGAGTYVGQVGSLGEVTFVLA
jgi:2-keto-4-pentenoate hydratase